MIHHHHHHRATCLESNGPSNHVFRCKLYLYSLGTYRVDETPFFIVAVTPEVLNCWLHYTAYMWIARPTFMLEALLCDNESHKFSIQHVKGEAGGCSETRTRHNNISYPTPCPLSYMPLKFSRFTQSGFARLIWSIFHVHFRYQKQCFPLKSFCWNKYFHLSFREGFLNCKFIYLSIIKFNIE